MIALSSELSRRAAEEAIERGEVTVNGERVTALGTTVDPKNDKVCLNGKVLRPESRQRYLAYNKPRGLIVSKSDEYSRRTIWNSLGDLKRELNSVGRLDKDSEGLIFLTNDGDFINMLTHPRHEIWKTYRVWVRGEPDSRQLRLLEGGVKLKEGKTLPAKVRVLKAEENNTLLEVSIREGKNRQIRRMFDAIECPVRSLKRISIGPVKIGRLKPGEWRDLRTDEVLELAKLTK